MAKAKHFKIESKPRFLMLILALVMILGGALVFLYPTISNLYTSYHQATVIQSYENSVAVVDEDLLKKAKEEAIIYNENLMGDPLHDPFVPGSGYALPENYTEVLNVAEDGVMGYIMIPKISVHLPIYHGTGTEVLEKGVGHIEQTALPIGGEGTHSVLTGHRGLATSELFSRLDELKTGDRFYISVLNDTIAYEVNEINTVLPYELEELAAINGKDLVTLVTCTPYGVNTHRLLVQGKRIEYTKEVQQDVSNMSLEQREMGIASQMIGIFVGLLLLAAFLVFLLVRKIRASRKTENI